MKLLLSLIASLLFCAPLHAEELRLDYLTSPQVAQAIKAGKRTAIIFAGSTEQNGAQIALGKHNRVADYLSLQLARELGDALAYPTIPFAPTGDPVKRDGHMGFAGSVSLREATYIALLQDVAVSAIAAGFKRILLMADHGEGQTAIGQLAQTLDQALRPMGIRVQHVSSIYPTADYAHAGLEDAAMYATANGEASTLGRALMRQRLDAALAQIRAFDSAP